MTAIRNRIEKNYKKLKPWSERHKIEAFRIYDRDIPEYPYIVDKYQDYLLIHDRREDVDFTPDKLLHYNELTAALREIFDVDDSFLIVKKREKQKGLSQYEKQDETEERFAIQESEAKFYVNLLDYLDTGLFLDHRLMRQKIFKQASGKKFLNLFSYTGSVSVFAALAGATVTSVDMSSTYTEWAKENFRLNSLDPDTHSFVCQNALEYLQKTPAQNFDLIFLDPPTFSNSKKMEDSFEVERDQDVLIESTMKHLKPEGLLYFSTNKRTFRLSKLISEKYAAKDVSKDTIPMDFHDQKIHYVFEIRHK